MTAVRVLRYTLGVLSFLALGVAPAFSALSVQLFRSGGSSAAHARGPSSHGGRSLAASAVAVPVEDCENLEYTGTIGLGTPVQEFRVVFSIVSSLLWVVNTDCEICESPSGGYDSSLSSTYEADDTPFTIDSAGGLMEAAGVFSVDVLTMGGVSTTVTFGEMNEVSLDGCTLIDGNIGMGLTNEYESNAFEDMVEAGVFDTPVFSFYVGNVDTDAPNNGVLTLGGVNQTHYEGCLEWMHVSEAQEDTTELPGSVSDGHWSVVLKDVKLGSESLLTSEATAVLDTGTPLIQGPYDDIAVIAEQIGATCISFEQFESGTDTEVVDCLVDPSSVGLIFVECDVDFGNLNFFFGGEDFALTATELLQPLEDFDIELPSTSTDPLCLFGMAGHEFADTWILGDPFLRNFYTAYNVVDKTVGIAPATSKRSGEECQDDSALGSLTPSGEDSSGDQEGGGGSDSPDVDSGSVHEDNVDEDSVDEDSAQDDYHDDDNGLDAASAPVDSSGAAEASGATEEEEQATSLMTVGVVASLATMALLGCGLAVLLVRHRWKRSRGGGTYRSTLGGGAGGGGGFEMSWSDNKRSSSSTVAGERRGGEAVEPEDDFLQASPRGSSSGGGGGGRVVRGVVPRRDNDEDEVDIDLAGAPPGATGTKAGGGVFGRLLGGAPARAGFAAFENAEEEGGGQ